MSYATLGPETKVALQAYLNARAVSNYSAQHPWPWLREENQPFIQAFLVALVIWGLYALVSQRPATPPRGRVPRIGRWLEQQAPKRPPRAVASEVSAPVAAAARRGRLAAVRLQPVGSLQELWEVYHFTSQRLVDEVPSMAKTSSFLQPAFSRSAIFPVFALEYSRYEACAVEEVNLGPSSSSIGFATDSSGKGDPLLAERKGKNEVDLVRECQKMVEDYGLSVVARDGSSDPSPVVGVATMRVKRLPTDCHITEEDDGTKEVECMVDFDAAYSAPGLEAVAYLEMIAVSKDWRGSGLSNKLMDWIETKARTWGLNILALHVHRDNWAALRFYERNGFEASSDWLGMGPSFFLLVKPL